MIQLQGVCLAFPHKTCFADFTASLDWGQRIAIVGDNGCGKSSLLNMLYGSLAPDAGQVLRTDGLRIGHVPQIVDAADGLSGGQAVNQALSRALALQPDLLLLDEPSNHLDSANRRALARMLRHFYGTVVIVTHDAALLDEVCDTVWHIEAGKVQVFSGRYADFLQERERQRDKVQQQLQQLRRDQHEAHESRMQEQQRASKAKERGARSIEQRKWATIRSPAKLGRGNTTAGRKQAAISEMQRELGAQLSALRRPEVIAPRFHLSAASASQSAVLSIIDGSVGYEQPVLGKIQLSLAAGERLALTGANGSGKSSLAKAIAGVGPVRRLHGEWHVPAAQHIGYLDQHYSRLRPGLTVLQTLQQAAPGWPMEQLRRHLSDFLFRQDPAVHADVASLSGGEKARLSLACIAANPPRLLILDEVTNNLDRTARNHVIEVLQAYPGAMLLISHDESFLQAMGLELGSAGQQLCSEDEMNCGIMDKILTRRLG
jgi:ATPase subunit of ABC transporter with duplicated ATPase domains